MAGIVFYRSENRRQVVDFYTQYLGFESWLVQDAGCEILKRDNLLLGFCDGEETESAGIVTVVVEDQGAVDSLYDELEEYARHPPENNEAFEIYQFFADDPDGRAVEIQTFLHKTPDLP